MIHLTKFHRLLCSIIFFVIVFYNKDVGVNVSLFAFYVWLLSYENYYREKDKKTFWLLSFGLFISIVSFVWYGDILSYFASFVCLFTIGIYTQYKNLNVSLFPPLLAYSFTTFIVRIFFLNKWLPKFKCQNNILKKSIAYVIIPLFFLIIFVTVYAVSSEKFASLFENIQLDFSPAILIATILLAIFICFNYWFMMMPDLFNQWNNYIDNSLKNNHSKSGNAYYFLDANYLRKSGEITLLLLNVLLLGFIIVYNYETIFLAKKSSNLTEDIHHQVAIVILSIVMAITVIMFYFKSSIKFDSKTIWLKRLAFIWILLNFILIVSAFFKNTEYIHAGGLTFKRVGVYTFLILSIIGLIYTYIKIKQCKSNWFLVNKMLVVFFIALIANAPINWSWIVTKYDLAKMNKPDVEYLSSLDYNKELLFKYFDENNLHNTTLYPSIKYLENKKSEDFLSSALYYKNLKLPKSQ